MVQRNFITNIKEFPGKLKEQISNYEKNKKLFPWFVSLQFLSLLW